MYSENWLNEIHVNEYAVIHQAKEYETDLCDSWKTLESLLLLKIITLIDLTTLGGDDTTSNVTSIINKALLPVSDALVHKIINSIVELLGNIYSLILQKPNYKRTPFKKQNNEKLGNKVTGENFNLLNKLHWEDVTELEHLLKIFCLNDKENLLENIHNFLNINSEKTDLHIKNKPEKNRLRVAAICVYPKFVSYVDEVLKSRRFNLILDLQSTSEINTDENFETMPIASVAAGFPSGQYGLESKLNEIKFAIESGATEIDVVISRSFVLGHRWLDLYHEIRALKSACKNMKMKTILATGECGSLENVYKASMVAMMAGSDFIKTSTGKESVNATFPVGLVMCRAIKNYYIKTGFTVGFKPAGGIKTSDDALKWLRMIVMELGIEWLPHFRIGASGLLDSIETRLKKLINFKKLSFCKD